MENIVKVISTLISSGQFKKAMDISNIYVDQYKYDKDFLSKRCLALSALGLYDDLRAEVNALKNLGPETPSQYIVCMDCLYEIDDIESAYALSCESVLNNRILEDSYFRGTIILMHAYFSRKIGKPNEDMYNLLDLISDDEAVFISDTMITKSDFI